jgi:hypothetical protein
LQEASHSTEAKSKFKFTDYFFKCCRPLDIFWILKHVRAHGDLFIPRDNCTISSNKVDNFLLVETVLSLFPGKILIFFLILILSIDLLQIAQFSLIFIHAFQLIFSNKCNYPMSFVWFIAGHAVLFYLLVKSKMRSDRLKCIKEKRELYENEKFEPIESKFQSTYDTTRHRTTTQ